MPNHLINETSPYLLQHAHNPVDWYPWNEEALRKAKEEDKPILVSIGYSACHWCHVMERESFEDPDIASIMNDGFINIKIDREERPDLDHIYMDALQAMTGSGGWPLNVFLTPEGKPFYGGTYFPPRAAFNKPSWPQLLKSIVNAFQDRRKEIDDQSEQITSHIFQSNSFGIEKLPGHSGGDSPFTKENMKKIYEQIMTMADRQLGGFGHAPKFPQTFIIRFLLQYYYYTREKAALDQVCISLDSMIAGGIYDQLAGGFARYSTDDQWLAPHFEKMLYDNALLVTVMSEAYQLTKNESYREAIEKTLAFISNELQSADGGFYSALDADSEGVEGKFYVWDRSEIETVLQQDAELFCDYYDVKKNGNWEGKNILHTKYKPDEYAKLKNLGVEDLSAILAASREKLFFVRSRRIRPQLDDKILMGWNGLLISACCKAYSALGTESYKEMGTRLADFLLERMAGTGLFTLFHTYKNGRARIPAFLDDYACLIESLIQLQEITGRLDYLLKAKELTEFVIGQFSEEETGYFFYTNKGQHDVIIRKKEVYDGALPSGNAVMASSLLYLAVVFDIPEWRERAISNCAMLAVTVIRYPSSFGLWATLLQSITYGMKEIVIIAEDPEPVRKEFLNHYIPARIFQSGTTQNDQFPLLKNKPLTIHPLIFLCKEYSCQNPVTEVDELIRILESV